jgi:hypothetical protein
LKTNYDEQKAWLAQVTAAHKLFKARCCAQRDVCC